jgi:uncharacterized protein (DUF952 family)
VSERLFHITTVEVWEAARAAGVHRAPSLETEGFIHLSTGAQWLRTANRFFRGQRDLVLLVIRTERLGSEVRFEAADGDSFPHLYGPLEAEAVEHAWCLPVEADGAIGVPPELDGHCQLRAPGS